MLAALIVAVAVQSPRPSVLGKDRPPDRALKPGDVVRIDTGIPNTGVPAIRLWSIGDDGATRSEVDYWAFGAALGTAEPLDQVHFMADRRGLDYCPSGTKVRVVAIHRDWGFGALDGVPAAEVEVSWTGADFGPAAPPGRPVPFAVAIPLPYLSGPARPDPALRSLPILRRSAERHAHRYCTVEPGERHGDHVDAVPFDDAMREYREKLRRARELGRKAKAEASRREGR